MTSDYEFLNCTPHDIVLYDADGTTVLRTFPKSNLVVRLAAAPQKQVAFQTLGVPVVTRQKFVALANEEELAARVGSKKDTTLLLVSMPVGEFMASRGTISRQYWTFGPDTGPDFVVRDAIGQIVGTRRLVLYSAPSSMRYQCAACGLDCTLANYCQTCSTEIGDEWYYIEGTRLHIRSNKIIRTAVGATPPLSPSTQTYLDDLEKRNKATDDAKKRGGSPKRARSASGGIDADLYESSSK